MLALLRIVIDKFAQIGQNLFYSGKGGLTSGGKRDSEILIDDENMLTNKL